MGLILHHWRFLLRAALFGLILAAVAGPTWTRARGPGQLIVLVDRSASMPRQWSADLLAQLPALLPDAHLTAYSFAGSAQPLDPAGAQRIDSADPADGSDPGPALQLAMAAANAHNILLLTDGNFTAPANWPADRRLWALCPTRSRANAGIIDLVITPISSAGAAGPTTAPAGPPAGPALLARATLSSTRDDFVTVRLASRTGDLWQTMPGTEQRVELASGQLRSVDWLIAPPAAPAGGSLAAGAGAEIRAELAADWDELPGDNQLTALIPPPAGERTVVLAATHPDDLLAESLARLPGWQVSPMTPEELARANLADLPRPPGAVVLDDLPADQLSAPLLAGLRRYLEGSGGLLAVGGPNSFGAGHYYDSPVEALLPVRSRPRLRPAAAIVLLLDRSGSMSQPPTVPTTGAEGPETGGPAHPTELLSKLDLLKGVVLSLPDLFAPGDRLAVIGFADQARTVYATSPGAGGGAGEAGPIDWPAVRKALLDMQAGGGTAIGPGIQAAADWLAQQDVPRKHLLLLTDGEFSDMTVDQADEALKQSNHTGEGRSPPQAVRLNLPAGLAPQLTVSTFAASDQADRSFLSDLARRFGGTFYKPQNWGELRDRFRDDLAGATADPIITAAANGVATGGGLIVQAQDRPAADSPVPLPTLSAIGKLLTTEARPQAEVWYSARIAQPATPTPAGDSPTSQPTSDYVDRPWPLVAVGPAGAGRSAAIATSFQPAWSGAWSAGQRRELLGRLLADLTGGGDDPRFVLQFTPDLGRHKLAIEVIARETVSRSGQTGGASSESAGARPIDGLNLSAELVSVAGQTRSVPLPQIGPGQYAAMLDWYDSCRLLVVEQPTKPVAGADRTGEGDVGQPAWSRTVLRRTLAAPLPVEFLHLSPLPDELDRLCRQHGGRLLESPAEVARLSLAPSPQPVELWSWLLLIALVLWLVDVAVTLSAGRRTI